MAVFSIQRCNPDDGAIVLDAGNGVVRVYGRQSSSSAPLHTAVLQHVENDNHEGGQLSFGSCGNVKLTIAEYIQAFHQFNEIKKLFSEER